MTEDNVIEALTYLMKLDRWLARSGSRLGDRHYKNAMVIARGGKPHPHAIEDLVLAGDHDDAR